MTLPPARKLSRYVEPAVTEGRVDRAWGRIASRDPDGRVPIARWRGAWWIPSVAAAALAMALGVVIVRNHSVAPTLAGMVIEGGTSGAVTMADGTRLVLAPAARVRWDRVEVGHIEATLETGEVHLDVPHVASRSFLVHAGNFDVIDLGTRFVVSVSGARVSVAVQSGRLEIRRRDASEPPRELGAGESWTSEPLPGPKAPVAPRESAEPSVPPVTPAADVGSSGAAGRGSLPPMPNPPPVAKPPGAKELLEAGNTARLAGRPREAAAAFDSLRKRYRTDPRASLAALELGRLRLDAFGDPREAVEAFDDAIALAPGGAFREDAEARRVEALDQLHSPECAAARGAYLARYPNGLHAAAVGARCAR